MARPFKTSLIIVTKNKPEHIIPCVKAIATHLSHHDLEVIVADTGTTHSTVLKFYADFATDAKIPFRVVDAGPYNFSKSNNKAAKVATGDVLVFLNNDTLGFDDWLTPLLTAWNRPEVGVVGSRLIFGTDFSIQHAGVEFLKLGENDFVGFHPYRFRSPDMPEVKRSKFMPAVTGACLGIRRSVFESIGGFDESYLSESQDGDLCFKVLQKGLKCLYVAESTLFHFENGSRVLNESSPEDRKRFSQKWGSFLNEQIFSKTHQSEYLENWQKRSSFQQVLFERMAARGDVIASMAVIEKFRRENPNVHITLKTLYPDVVQGFDHVDRVLHWHDPDPFKYDVIFDLDYESGTWTKFAETWIEHLFRKVFPHEKPSPFVKYSVPKASTLKPKIEVLRRLSANLPQSPYVIIAVKAGWKEKEWPLQKWEELIKALTTRFQVLQVGGPAEPVIPGTIPYLGLDLEENLTVLRNAKFMVCPDTFALHLAWTAGLPTAVLTCKTSKESTLLADNMIEVRNTEAPTTPLALCKTHGCRFKFGDGLDNECDRPILHELRVEHVLNRLKSMGVWSEDAAELSHTN